MSMPYRLNHIHLVCKDLQQMIDFFTENFNATLIGMRKFGGADGASLDLGGTTVNLRVPQENEKLLENPNGKTFGYHHMGIEVDDIDAKHRELTEKGYVFSVSPKDIENMRIAFFDGPENVTFELLQLKG
jgi:catechol 2,3-dioxygenase-like lactoylglutathione lyase family enzyme